MKSPTMFRPGFVGGYNCADTRIISPAKPHQHTTAKPDQEMTQAGIYRAFNGRISKKAIQLIDDEWRIVGKWCYVTRDNSTVWDVWICNPADLHAGLGQRKVRNMISSLNRCTGEPFHELTGEAWGKVRGTEVILNNLALLGIRRKRIVSEQQRKVLADRLRAGG